MERQRSRVEKERDRARIAQLYCEGKTLRDIARDLSENYDGGIAFQTISKDLKHIREEWRKSRIRDFDLAKAEELAKIDRVEAEAWSEWFRSRMDKEQQAEQHTERPGPNPAVGALREVLRTTKRHVKIERRDGNPYFLDLVLRCVEKRCKILGLDAPSKISIGGDGVAGIEAMVALAQNPDEYAAIDPLLPAEAYERPPAEAAEEDAEPEEA